MGTKPHWAGPSGQGHVTGTGERRALCACHFGRGQWVREKIEGEGEGDLKIGKKSKREKCERGEEEEGEER